MMGWSMSEGGIWVGSPPSEDRRTIDDEIACANQATTNGHEHREDKETFIDGGFSCSPALTLLRVAGNAEAPLLVVWETTRQA
jgi:hypothetical protein